MRKEFQKVAILGRHDDPRVAEPMTALVAHLTKVGATVLASEEMSLPLDVSRVPEADLPKHADLVIAIGGDGTILYAGRLTSGHDVPLLGINRGRLGFLADVTPDEMLDSVDHVLNGDYTTDSRMQLEAHIVRRNGEQITATALNDVVLQRSESARMLDFETRVGDHYVNTHSGDGLIVATPTGSTAYALSCGGPILESQLDAFVVVPICPHTLTDRPIVMPAQQTIAVHLLERKDTSAGVSVDGQSMGSFEAGDVLTLRAAKERIMLVHPPYYDFYGILRSKLFWGRDSRVRDGQEN